MSRGQLGDSPHGAYDIVLERVKNSMRMRVRAADSRATPTCPVSINRLHNECTSWIWG